MDKGNQNERLDSDETRMRKTNIRSNILRVADLFAGKSALGNPNPFYEVARADRPYEPAERLQMMMRDVARTAKRYGKESEARTTLTNFYNVLLSDALSPLSPERDADVVSLYLEKADEEAEAIKAEAVAISCQTAPNLERAAEETAELSTITSRLALAFKRRAASLRSNCVVAVMR